MAASAMGFGQCGTYSRIARKIVSRDDWSNDFCCCKYSFTVEFEYRDCVQSDFGVKPLFELTYRGIIGV